MGYTELKQLLADRIVGPMIRGGVRSPPDSLLLFGPAGTGKTALGRVMASQLNAKLLYVPAAALLERYAHLGHRIIRALFRVARRMGPTVLFFEDIDMPFGLLSWDSKDVSASRLRVELLAQLDGMHPRAISGSEGEAVAASVDKAHRPVTSSASGSAVTGSLAAERSMAAASRAAGSSGAENKYVLVVGSTRHPSQVDPSVAKAFRMRHFVPLPDGSSREALLQHLAHMTGTHLDHDRVEDVTARTEGFACRDLINLWQAAAEVQPPVAESTSTAGPEDASPGTAARPAARKSRMPAGHSAALSSALAAFKPSASHSDAINIEWWSP